MMSSLRVQAMTNTISHLFYGSWHSSSAIKNLNCDSPYAYNKHKSPLKPASPHEGPLLTFIRARRCTNHCWGLHLPICADPLIPGDSDGYLKCVTLRPSALEILRPGRRGEDMLVHLGIESITPSYRRNLFILSLYDDMLAGAGAAQRCTYPCLVIIGHGHDNARHQ